MIKHYRDYIPGVAESDAEQVIQKDLTYGSSWMRRGGIGAFMMLARKWDRIEELVSKSYGWDIFKAVEDDGRETDGVIDDIRDLRRYLLLVEAELIARGAVPAQRRMDSVVVPRGGAVSEEAGEITHTVENKHLTPVKRVVFLTSEDYRRKQSEGGVWLAGAEAELFDLCGAKMGVCGHTEICVREKHPGQDVHVYVPTEARCHGEVAGERCVVRTGHKTPHLAAFYATVAEK